MNNEARHLQVPRPTRRASVVPPGEMALGGVELDSDVQRTSSAREPERRAILPLRPAAAQVAEHSRPTPVAPPREASLSVSNIAKSYHKGSIEVPVLCGVDLEVFDGELLAIVGQSGCGKSTLLHLMGTLDEPDSGEIHFHGNRIDNLPAVARDVLRNRHFGMIFQFYHLLPELTTLENVLAPIMISEGVFSYMRRRGEYRQRALDLLEMVGLSHRLKHRPRELSGGEMQRAAIARALVSEPEVLLADEPTGNLDEATGEGIMQILRSLNRDQNLTIVMVTHDMDVAEGADRAIRLAEGRVETA